MLKEFNLTKEDSWRDERTVGQQVNLAFQQRQAVRLILFLCVIVTVLVIVLGVVSTICFFMNIHSKDLLHGFNLVDVCGWSSMGVVWSKW